MVVVGRVAFSTSGLRVWLGTALTVWANMSAKLFSVLLTVLVVAELLAELFTELLTALSRTVVMDMSFLQ